MNDWKKLLRADPTKWLLESNPWTEYQTLLVLEEKTATDHEVKAAKQKLLNHTLIKKLILEATDWIPQAPSTNNDPKISFFKLGMLADFGIRIEDQGIGDIIQKAVAHSSEGFYAIRGQLPERPEKGEKFIKPDPAADVWHVAPCNAPALMTSLFKIGFRSRELDNSVYELSKRWNEPSGWFCNLFFVQSQFRKTGAGCPMAGLKALEVFSYCDQKIESATIENCFSPIEYHWKSGKSLYYFGRSKKFFTLKYPFVWYNALYMADIMVRFPALSKHPMVKELIDWILHMQDENGRFQPNSVYLHYKGWDFADKKQPSPWISFLCCRILKNYCRHC